MDFALTVHHCVNQLKLEAKNTSLLLSRPRLRPGCTRNQKLKTENTSLFINKELFKPLFRTFASIQDDKSLKNGNHCFAEVIETKSLPNIKWVNCDRNLAEDVRLHVYQGVGIRAAPPCTRVRRVTLISRQPYPQGRRRHVTRIIDNEEDLLEGLRAGFPSMQINLVRLELHSVEEQLAIVNETDALIGMHGAGMGYATLLPTNAAVLEMFPFHFRLHHYFTTFYIASAARDLHYRRWLQLLPWRKRASDLMPSPLSSRKGADKHWKRQSMDLTTVSVRAIASRLRALERDVAASAKKRSASAKALD